MDDLSELGRNLARGSPEAANPARAPPRQVIIRNGRSEKVWPQPCGSQPGSANPARESPRQEINNKNNRFTDEVEMRGTETLPFQYDRHGARNLRTKKVGST